MPRIPTVQLDQPLPAQRFPVAGPEAYGAQIGESFSQLGDVFNKIQAGEDQFEAGRLISEGQVSITAARQLAKEQISDPQAFAEAAPTQIQNAYNAQLAAASNPRVKRLVQGGLQGHYAAEQRIATLDLFTKKKDKARGDLDADLTLMSKDAASALSRESQNAIYAAGGDKIRVARELGFLSEQEAVNRIQAFDKQVLMSRATQRILTDPEAFLAESSLVSQPNNDYRRLGDDEVLKLQDKATTRIATMQAWQDKAANKIRTDLENSMYSAALYGQLDKVFGADIDKALHNQHPMGITPKTAEQLKELNEKQEIFSKNLALFIMVF